MTRGRHSDPTRAARGTGHRPGVGETIVEYAPQKCSSELVQWYAEGLPAGTAVDLFLRSVEELGDRLNDFDLQLLQEMAIRFSNAEQAQADVVANGIFESTPFGRKPNPALKIARDELRSAMQIADQYALTFVSRLRAGIMQLAGESMLRSLHSSMAEAVVSAIVASEVPELPAANVCPVCAKVCKSKAGLASHMRSHK